MAEDKNREMPGPPERAPLFFRAAHLVALNLLTVARADTKVPTDTIV